MATIDELPDADLIELEPTIRLDPPGHGAGAGIALVEGPQASLSGASLSGERDALRRQRLLAAAMFLAATFALLFVWVFASDNPGTLTAEGSRSSLRVGLLALRCLLAAAVAGLLASEAPLTHKQLRATEYVLFLGLTALILTSQYFVNLDLVRRGPEYLPIILAFIKDGVIQMMALMLIYGMLIPNPPLAAARVLALMLVGSIATGFFLKFHPDVNPVVAQLEMAEEAGSNILFLAVGAALAVYGCYLVNGLRSELREARKFGQYKLVRRLGAGGMGEVYLAEHALLKRPCALKLIRPDSGDSPLALARFEREVQSAARLAHPNTIAIYDYGHTDDGTFYYVMEYLAGMGLDELVRRFGPLPAGRAIFLLRQVCAGLAEAHALGLVHRDLKPANIYIAVRGGESDVAKVLDFGLVKLTHDPAAPQLTADQSVSGTPSYMSPEQAVAQRDLDARSDIYSLGAVAYFALTGRPPFEGDGAMAVMIAHARDPVAPPSQYRPGLPADLEQVVLRCLAKKPEDRYPTAKALDEALAACAASSEWGPHRAEAWWASAGPVEDRPPTADGPSASNFRSID
jgi:serine/threonine-protein kinase